MKQGILWFALVMTLGLGVLVMRMEDEVVKIGQLASDLEETVAAAEVIVAEVAPEPATPEYQNYWNYEEMFEAKEDELTDMAFEEWERTQEGIKVQVVGTVVDVESRDYWDDCLTGVKGPDRKYFAQFLDCDVMRSFKKGDPITLNCIMGDDGIISPDVDHCKIQ